jgi:hypothetical protein
VLIAAAIYYLITQTTDTMNDAWHTAVSNDNFRHYIRDVWEGLMGGLLGQQVIWNHYRKRKPITRLERFEKRLWIASPKDSDRLKIREMLVSPGWVGVYAIPGNCPTAGPRADLCAPDSLR